MDNEMMAKVNDVLKANGNLGLSQDELEEIVRDFDPPQRPGPNKIIRGYLCPNCGSTHTLGINGNCVCFDCHTKFTV